MRQKLLLSFLSVFCFASLFAQTTFWTDRSESAIDINPAQRKIVPEKYRVLSLDTAAIRFFLRSAPKEFSADARLRKFILLLPKPDGGFERFSVMETEVMAPGLQARFPEIRVYGGQGLDDSTATLKIDIGPQGFHAAVRSARYGAMYIDPYAPGLLTTYIAYYKKDLKPGIPFTEEADPESNYGINGSREAQTQAFNGCTADTLRRYRLAVACTGEYAVAVGGSTTSLALAAIVTSINRVNGVYETELAIRLVLVENEALVVFTDPATDPFTQNNNGNGLLTENRRVCDSLIGNANYDIGHAFSTGAGGVAGLGVVCNTTNKARGVTGLTNPTGDAYDIDYVAHEMGHQFGGNHTFNSVTGSCNGNRSAAANAEPGSATSIMGYAGICRANDLQLHSDAFFHPVSYNEITNYTINGTGNGCPAKLLTGNTAPVVYAGLDYTIPKSTPFMLTGSATDADGDMLTYAWDEVDVGGPAGNWNLPVGQAPLFRFFPPTTSTTRYFPKLADIVNNTTTVGEILPNYARTINMRFTARDNRAGGGGNCWDQTLLTVNAAAGPFLVLYPNTTADSVKAGTIVKVKWDVAGTNAAPVSCDSVMIELSLDGGYTYPIVLLSKTLNSGTADVVIPNNPTTTARIRVKAQKNVFFDISNQDFKIIANTASEFLFNEPDPVLSCDGVNPTVRLQTLAVNGFPTPITLSASGAPAGTTVVFASTIINPNSSVLITLQGTAAPGSYNITVTGTAGSVVKTRVVQFNVGIPSVPSLTAPANNSLDNVLTPTLTWAPWPGASTYTLQISTDAGFATTLYNVSGITTNSYMLPAALAQNARYYWRVSATNGCGTGPVSNAASFKTGFVSCGPDTLRSTNVPVAIPLGISTVSSTLTIPFGSIISDLDVVGLRGTHTYVSDLAFFLQSPAGTRVTLFNWQCTSNANFDINLDDEAASATITCPPTGGQVRRPLQPLSAFDNQNSTGTWTLFVSDGAATQQGSLTGWGLRICTYSASFPLPVNWLSFTAAKNADGTVAARWQTANEVNNNHYEVERSVDGRNFSLLGSIAAGPNAAGLQTYLYTDLAPLTGTSYYRVRQVDNDGRSVYSAVAKVSLGKAGVLWEVYPNPATNHVTVYARAALSGVRMQLLDVAGKLLYNAYLPALRTGGTVNIPLQNLSRGTYVLKVVSGDRVDSEKIVVQ